MKRGIALVYALLVSTVFVVFFIGLLLLSRDTMSAVRYDERMAQAKLLANTANEFAFHILSRRQDNWYQGEFSISNDPDSPDYFLGVESAELKAQFSQQNLGGTFRVESIPVDDARAEGVTVPEGGGTYLVLHATADVQGVRTTGDTSSRFLVKVGNPFVNNLACARGLLQIHTTSKLNGPVLVARGDESEGVVRITSHFRLGGSAVGDVIHPATNEIAANITARGPIVLANLTDYSDDAEVVPVRDGTYQAGDTLTLPTPPLNGAILRDTGIGGALFTAESVLKSHQSLEPRFPPGDELFDTIATVHSGEPTDITAYPGGVLLEFEDDIATLYEFRKERIGRVYDLAILLTYWEGGLIFQDFRNLLVFMYGNEIGGFRAALREVDWDDSAFPEEPIPELLRSRALAVLRSLDSTASDADIPTQGNYFDLYRPVPGPQIAQWRLNRGNWTAIRLISNSLSAQNNNGAPVAPTVFVRGRVEGKVLVANDLAESELPLPDDRDETYCDIVVLSEPDEARGIAGGVRLKDETFADSNPNSRGSDDRVMLISRGGVKAWGMAKLHLGWLIDPSGNRQDLRTPALASLSQKELDSMNWDYSGVPAHLSGVTCSGKWQAAFDLYNADFKATPESENSGGQMPNGYWEQQFSWDFLASGSAVPGGISGQNWALVPRAFRYAWRPRTTAWLTNGAHSSLDRRRNFYAGNHTYDYSWRNLSAEHIHEQLGLPLSLILIDRENP